MTAEETNENKAFYTGLFNQAYNVGIDRCINFVNSQQQLYKALDPMGVTGTAMVLESISSTLAHFKKKTEIVTNETVS